MRAVVFNSTKKYGKRNENKFHEFLATIDLTNNQKKRKRHFTREERLKLNIEYYWETNGFKRENSTTLVLLIFLKSPKEVNSRLEAGHWNGDTFYTGKKGSRQCLLTLKERVTRLEIIRKIKDRTADSVKMERDKLEQKMGSRLFKVIFESITFINSSKFSHVDGLKQSCHTKSRRTDLYFAHPYCNSKRGTNENQTASSGGPFPRARTSQM